MKNSVNSFIDNIASKATDEVTHKIAIVKFAGDKTNKIGNDMYTEGWLVKKTYNYTQIVENLTLVKGNTAGLKDAVNKLSPAGATAADWGLEKAKEAFGSETADPNRQRVVIMFTDGEPNHDNGFENTVANAAIGHANSLKNKYSSLVYTIGIFSGANVSDMNGRTNRYMNLVSSNYPNATDMNTPGTGSVTSGYYKVAADANELQSAFDNISTSIGQSGSNLNSTAVLTDVVAPNFKAPKDANEVKLYTAAYNGTSFGDRTEYTGATVNIGENGAVTVTGFDYSANFVSAKPHPGTTDNYGKKLIVEFTIEVDRTKTYGGTQPTNAGAKIDLGDETIIEVANPQVPVAITQPTISDVPKEKPYDGTGFDIKNTFKDEIATQVPTNGSKNEYVNIVYTIKDDKGNEVGKYTVDAKGTNGKWSSAEALTTPADVGEYVYTVTCTISDANTTEPHAASVSAEGTMTFKITTAPGLTVEGTDYNGIYDGASHGDAAIAKIDGEVVNDATISYKVGNGEWTTAFPTVKDVADSTKFR